MDTVREIVEGLNQPPFEKGFTLIGFDSITPEQLISVLNDVFVEIAPDHDVDTRTELPEDRVMRMMSLLRVLRFKPSIPAPDFAAGLLDGQRDVIYPIIHWALPRVADLKKRAYLANYLMTIEVPAEMMQNEEVVGTREEYLNLIEAFKETHKDVEQLRSSGFSLLEVKNDIQSMEREKEQIQKRIARMKQKYEGSQDVKKMLEATHKVRKEEEREEQLEQQRQDQTEQLSQAEDRLQRTMQLLRETKANAITGGPQAVLSNLEEEVKMRRFISQQKLTQSIEEKKNAIRESQRILSDGAMTQGDLNPLHQQIQDLTREMNEKMAERVRANAEGDDKLPMFKQQAAIISSKKQAVAEKLQDAEDELAKVEKDYHGRVRMAEAKGPRILKDDELKKYVAKVRTKGTAYKEKKSKMTQILNENITLTNTVGILERNEAMAKHALSKIEAQHGVSGVTDAQSKLEDVSATKSEIDTRKGAALDDISKMVMELNKKITSKRAVLAPLITALRDLRVSAQSVKGEYEEKKEQYDSQASSLHASKARLESQVKGMREEMAVEESRYHYLQHMLKHANYQLQRAQREMKLYLGQVEGKSLRDVITKKIQEQERLGKQLRDRKKEVEENHEGNMQQLEMWRDLEVLMKAKESARNTMANTSYTPVGLEEEDRLVL
eukprot:m.39429 g.39429  ORF g.39429 m.39429 type:complete len:667 (-) comp10288_c0_seq1:85-2085(-)